MAYDRGRYNPDALPAHAEPEQAAAMMSGGSSSSRRDDHPQRQSSYSSKPQPPPPVSTDRSRYDDRNRVDSPSQYRSSRDRPSDRDRYSGGSGGGGGGGYSDYDRRPARSGQYDSRYDDGHAPPPRRSYEARDGRDSRDSYGSRGGAPPAQQAPRQSQRGDPERDELWRMFLQVDRDRSGQLSEQELGSALINGDYTAFDPHTVRMMIRMFDVDHSGTISFDEFCGLWGFLAEWRKLFDRFDADRSGGISLDEFSNALVAFGYRLSPDYVAILFSTYDTRKRGTLSFDLFVQACISLRRMTDVFKKYDTDRDGYITLSFEEFLAGAQSLFLFDSISPRTDRGER